MKHRIPSHLTLIALIGSGCSGPTEPVAIATIQVTAPSTTLASGATVQLTAATVGKNGKALTDRVITWSSSNQAIATVSATGLVTAGKVLGGMSETTIITASAEGISGIISISITPIPISSIRISIDTLTLTAGASQQVTVIITSASNDTLTNRLLTWTSADSTIATALAPNTIVAKPYSGFSFKNTSLIVRAGNLADTLIARIRPGESFDGYKVAANARTLGTSYWENTTVPIDMVLRVFFTRHKNNGWSQYSGWAFAATSGDFNDDGFADVFTAGSACGGMQSRPTFLIWNRDSLRFDERHLFRDSADFLGGPVGIEPVYLNNDNRVDLVIHGHSDECANIPDPADVILAISAPDGFYDLIYLNLTPSSVGQVGGEEGDVADVTGDGLPDLYLTNNSHSYIFRGIPDAPYFTATNPIHFASDTVNYPSANNGFGERVPQASEFAFGGAIRFDVDGDGQRDLIVQTTEDSTAKRSTRVFYNLGSGRFNNSRYVNLPYYYADGILPSGDGQVAHNMDVIVADVNGDGRQDIIATNQESYQNWNLVVYIAQADGSFTIDRGAVSYKGTAASRQQYKIGLTYADYNGDGLLDVGYASGGISCNNFPTTVFIRQGSRLVEQLLSDVSPYGKHLADLVKYSPC